MSRRGREGRKRRIARSRRRSTRRHRGCTYAVLYGWRTMPDSITVDVTTFYTDALNAIESIVMGRFNRLNTCRGCLYTNENYAYCGIGMSPDVRRCNHKELLMEESYD